MIREFFLCKAQESIFLLAGLFCLTVTCQSALGFGAIQDAESAESSIDFTRDIKPLFSDRCYQCHGPDSETREGGFRLDDPSSAMGEADSGEFPIVPGKPDESELLRRIMLPSDDIDAMPPRQAHKPYLKPAEVAKIRAWIEAGAKFEKHWSFDAPQRPAVPRDPSGWSENPIDRFVLNRMKEHRLKPSERARSAKLLRRLTFDLTGLPPTVEELEEFQSDRSENAYELAVDRLLNSPRYGEHMARYWLDAVRYGDTHGLHLDNYREIWPYRDWVIQAFNQNMNWADFTTKQIAGDLLESPSQSDLIASGYNRLHVTTSEGGSIAEEVYVRNVVDRVSTTGSVFLGLSVGCAQCHDHKFDPISAQDFYSMFAIFNNLDANPLDGNAKDHAPVLRIPTTEISAQLAKLDREIKLTKDQIDQPNPEFDAEFKQWQTTWRKRLSSRWTPLPLTDASSQKGATLAISPDKNQVAAKGDNPATDVFEFTFKTKQSEMTGIKLDVLLGKNGLAGRASNGNAVLSEIQAEIRPSNSDGEFSPLKFVTADADFSQDTYPVMQAIDGTIDNRNGWAIGGHQKKENRTATFSTDSPFGFDVGTTIRVRLVFETSFAQHSFQKVRFATTTDTNFGNHRASDWSMAGPFDAKTGKAAFDTDFGPEANVDLKKTYTHTNNANKKVEIKWAKRSDFVDGKTHVFKAQDVGSYYLYREIISPGERQLAISMGSDDGIKVWLNEQSVLSNNVARGVAADQESLTLNLVPGINRLLVKIVNQGGAAGFYYSEKESKSLLPNLRVQRFLNNLDDINQEQMLELRKFYSQSSPILNKLNNQLKTLTEQRKKIEATQPTTLIMKERMEPKPAYVLTRGQYDQPDKEQGPLSRRVPSFLPPLPDDVSKDRLGFAKWLIAEENPLMARVTVNRIWQQFMGAGIVTTADDFGSQGTPPTHPDLLDWLAVEFRETNWDVKRLVKSIVMSSTYRQDSKLTQEILAADPKNQWLSRGPRFRLDAEMLRDQALSVSGLLYHKIGGPGVKPPQPLGLWKSVGYTSSNTANFKSDSGREKVHRRSIYTFWKRTSPPPQMAVFDAPTREECVVSRERTNNPLQALLLLNDPQYFEAARHLAERVIHDAPTESVQQRASRMFRLATLRTPNETETKVLTDVFEGQLKVYQDDPDSAKTLIEVGAFPAPQDLDISEVAAWTMVANVVLNLDEIINKQ